MAGWFAGQFYPQPPALDDLPKELQSAVEINSSMNSKVSVWSLRAKMKCQHDRLQEKGVADLNAGTLTHVHASEYSYTSYRGGKRGPIKP